jgi:hypothetical protein
MAIVVVFVAPIVKAMATVAPNAAQYGHPASISSEAMKVENIAISPCAKFTWCVLR